MRDRNNPSSMSRRHRYGCYLIFVRLLETSLLVFFKKRSTKAMIATAVAVVSLTVAEKYEPWLRDSDDKVRACDLFVRSLSHRSFAGGRNGVVGAAAVDVRAAGV